MDLYLKVFLRLASIDDLSQLKFIYKKIVDNMNSNKLEIWDEIYTCEFLKEHIENNRLYVLVKNNEIIGAFALCDSNAGEEYIKWENKHAKALYIDRFGINVNYLKKGMGSVMLKKAIALANHKKAKYLRLFVVDENEPAINLYIKNGFKKAEGIYDEVIDDDFILHEYGFEIETTM